MPVPARSFTPEQLADARYRCEETDEPHASIAKRLGISERTLRRNIVRWSWEKRRHPRRINRLQPAPPPAAPAPPAPTPEDNAAAADIEATAHRAVEAIRTMVARLPKGRKVSAVERIARALATLTRTLQEVIRLRSMQAAQNATEPEDDRGPADPDEFARLLLRRLGEFRARRSTRVPDGAASGGA